MFIMDEEKFKKMFIDPTEEAEAWEEKIITGDINSKEVEELLMQANEFYQDEWKICTAIEGYTSVGKKEEREGLLFRLKSIPWVKDIKIEENHVLIDTEKGLINFQLINESLPECKDDLRLLTGGRKGYCHSDAVKMSTMLEKENAVVTGYVYGMADKAKYFHSWVEMSNDGKDYVIDYTMNAIMNKEAYYMLKHAEELSRVSNEQITEDWKIMKQLTGKGIFFMDGQYLAFRDEIMRDLKKNFGDTDKKDKDIEDR